MALRPVKPKFKQQVLAAHKRGGKRNANDLTLINLRAMKKRMAVLEGAVEALSNAVSGLLSRSANNGTPEPMPAPEPPAPPGPTAE